MSKTTKPAPDSAQYRSFDRTKAAAAHRLLFKGDKLVAAEAGILTDEQRTALKTSRFTAYLKDADNSGEEIDVDALDKASAKALVLQLLAVDYVDGLTIGKLVEQFGMY